MHLELSLQQQLTNNSISKLQTQNIVVPQTFNKQYGFLDHTLDKTSTTKPSYRTYILNLIYTVALYTLSARLLPSCTFSFYMASNFTVRNQIWCNRLGNNLLNSRIKIIKKVFCVWKFSNFHLELHQVVRVKNNSYHLVTINEVRGMLYYCHF